MPSGGVASGLGAVASGLLGASGSKSAAKAQLAATEKTVEEDRRQYEQNRKDLAPWRDTGSAALFTLADLLGINTRQRPTLPDRANYTTTIPGTPSGRRETPFGFVSGAATPDQVIFDQQGYNSAYDQYLQQLQDYENYTPSGELLKDFSLADFEADPGYNFRRSEGEKALDRLSAARGNYFSGGAGKDFLRFNQNLASDEFTNAYNRDALNKDRKFNYLSGVAGTGQNATNQLIASGDALRQSSNNAILASGNARAAGIVGGTNAIGQGISNAINNYQFDKFLNTYQNSRAA